MSRRASIHSLVLLAGFALAACESPEAERGRGGGPGADTGNRDARVEMHGGSVIYFNIPCNTTLPRCDGPLPQRTARRQADEH